MPASIPALFSTDDFWLVPASDGSDTSGYVHDAMRLSEAHAWNQARAIAAMESRSSDFVVIDNTNLCLWEARPYVEAAVRCDYTVCAQEPDTPWWQARDAEQLFSRGTHGVPLEAIVRMLERFEEPFSVEAVLNAVPPQRRAKQRGRNNNMRNGNGSNNKF
ncbi:NEDD4-binding protein 2 [Entophlyctis luteolus]|nr:NEDD4-binding protein 2 [Entophlyctis luteolus]